VEEVKDFVTIFDKIVANTHDDPLIDAVSKTLVKSTPGLLLHAEVLAAPLPEAETGAGHVLFPFLLESAPFEPWASADFLPGEDKIFQGAGGGKNILFPFKNA